MNSLEISQYHKGLVSLLKSEPDRAQRRAFLAEERKSPEYIAAKEEAFRRNHPDVLQPQEDSISSMIASLESVRDRELFPQEQTMLWAYKTLDEYNRLPIKGNYSERKKVKRFLEEKADYLLQNPQQLDDIASIWKSRTSPADSSRDSFYEIIKNECSQRIRNNREKVTGEHLAEIVKVYAHSKLAPDIAESILKGYLMGPGDRHQIADRLHEFVYGLIDLVSDEKALEKGLLIAWNETDIVPRESSFFYNIEMAKKALDDERLLRKGLNITAVLFGLSTLISLDTNSMFKRYGNFISSSSMEDRAYKEFQKIGGKIGYREMQRRKSILDDLYLNKITRLVTFEGDLSQLPIEWPLGLMLSEKDPLRKKFNDKIASLVIAKGAGDFQAREKGLVPVTVPAPEGIIFEVFMPSNLSVKQKGEIIQLILKQKHRPANELPPVGAIVSAVEYGNEIINFLVRKPAVIESNKHELRALSNIGFPAAIVEGEGRDRESQRLADEILRSQIRFLNRRGVRVPLDGQLKEMGYSHIDFHKDANSDRVLARVFVGDRPYVVKLDRYLNLDLEGKRLDNLALAESLRYVFLSLLRPILCEERIKDPHLQEADLEERETVSRMGHLRWLPVGQRFSKAAVENYLRLEQKDLFVTNMQRMEEHPDRGETTYVKPVVEKEENLPPITIHLPGVLQFN